MKKITKLFIAVCLCAFALTAFGCGSDDKKAAETKKSEVIKIGVTAGPHAEIMDQVKKIAEKQGLKIEVVEFTDFVTPNVALFQEELFANSMQHKPYLEATNKKDPKFDLVETFKTVTFPMASYSQKLKKGEAIPDGATIAIPNDPSNGGRALLLLAEKNLIKVKNPKDVTTSVADIVENPHNYKFQELDAATVPRSLPDVTLAVINANYALNAGLNPIKDSLFIESPESPYVCIFVTKDKNKKDPRIEQLKKIYQSPEIEKYIADHFKGSVIVGWK